jgi:hypothetical protein
MPVYNLGRHLVFDKLGINTTNHQAGMRFKRPNRVCKTYIGGSIPPRTSKIIQAVDGVVACQVSLTRQPIGRTRN